MKQQTSPTVRLVALALCTSLVAEPLVFAQQSTPPAQSAAASPAAAQPGSKTFSQQQLDELLAPIALYPDALLAQVLMASTYPLEVVEAARWQKANPSLKEKALEDELQKQSWDPSVKSLTAVPQVLTMMNEKLDWTTKLGDAFLAQQADVLKTTQGLRVKAETAGNLKNSKEMTVKKETENNVQVIKIEQPSPEVVYVPSYNPATVYGPWWYSAPPPYYYYPPGYGYGAGLAFATGVVVGAAIWGNVGWGNNEININSNRYNNFNKTNISNSDKWKHNSDHRKGAAYRDNATAQKYDRGGDRQASQSRDQFRGKADQGRAQMSTMDRGQLQAADRSAASQRSGGGQASARDSGGRGDGGRSSGASASQRSGGFSGSGGGGASARSSSSRGSSSMSRGGGGGGRGGGGGGRR